MYYRVYDQQTGTYFATGYNSESMSDLIKSFQQYIYGCATMIDDEDILNMTTWEQIADALSEVELEESETPFEDDNNF